MGEEITYPHEGIDKRLVMDYNVNMIIKDRKRGMNKTQEAIVKVYKDRNMWRPPSLQQIASKVKCSKTYVQTTLRDYLEQNKAFGLEK